jgi:hypothetical protein
MAAPLHDVATAHAAGLRYVAGAEPGLTRERRGPGFRYRDADGRPVDATTRRRIAALAIPPAWRDVWIARDARAHLQATGRDARGRKQYRYHPDWSAARDAAKYDRLRAFARALPAIRARMANDLRARPLSRAWVLATVVRLLDGTVIRIGNTEYRRTNGSYGLTTLLNRHAHVKGSVLTLKFRAKSGIAQEVTVVDAVLARLSRRRSERPRSRGGTVSATRAHELGDPRLGAGRLARSQRPARDTDAAGASIGERRGVPHHAPPVRVLRVRPAQPQGQPVDRVRRLVVRAHFELDAVFDIGRGEPDDARHWVAEQRGEHNMRRAGVDDAHGRMAAPGQAERDRRSAFQVRAADDGFDTRGHGHDVAEPSAQVAEQPRGVVAATVDANGEALRLERTDALGRNDFRQVRDEPPQSGLEARRVAIQHVVQRAAVRDATSRRQVAYEATDERGEIGRSGQAGEPQALPRGERRHGNGWWPAADEARDAAVQAGWRNDFRSAESHEPAIAFDRHRRNRVGEVFVPQERGPAARPDERNDRQGPHHDEERGHRVGRNAVDGRGEDLGPSGWVERRTIIGAVGVGGGSRAHAAAHACPIGRRRKGRHAAAPPHALGLGRPARRVVQDEDRVATPDRLERHRRAWIDMCSIPPVTARVFGERVEREDIDAAARERVARGPANDRVRGGEQRLHDRLSARDLHDRDHA